MQVTARVDYALRALLELTDAHPARLSRDDLAERQNMPPRYLEAILRELAQARLVVSHRGASGGYVLARPANEISVAEVARVIDGPLALVAQQRPESMAYSDASAHLGSLWIGLRAAIRSVMEHVTIADVAAGTFPPSVRHLLDDPDAWVGR